MNPAANHHRSGRTSRCATPASCSIRTRWWLLLGAALVGVAIATPTGRDFAAPDQTLRNEYPGTPAPRLTPVQTAAFDSGALLFSRIWRPEDGLGRSMNATSCAQCHHNPLPGGNEFAPATFVAHSLQCADAIGGKSCPKFQLDSLGKQVARALPKDAASRKPQSLFGLGMLAAVSDATLLALARQQEKDPDGVRGMVGLTTDGRVARFGWKARFAGIDDFVAAAFRVEFGMTSALYPGSSNDGDSRVEVSADTVRAVSDFIRYLAAPPLTLRGDVSRGREVFAQLRCTACHVPSLRTSASAKAPFQRLSIYAYTDLLLHDMGEALSDGIPEGRARPSQFRTPALWGLNASGPPYLHDGRASTIGEAIRLHGGEAAASAARFQRLPAEDVAVLLRFLNSL